MGLLMRTGAGESMARMQETGVSFAQMIVLYTLHARGAVTVSAIAERTKLSLPTASQMIERMVRDGLVSRAENPDDRRSRLVRITPRGEQLLASLHDDRHRELAATLGLLPEPVAARFGEILAEVATELEHAMAEKLRGEAPRAERRAYLETLARGRTPRR